MKTWDVDGLMAAMPARLFTEWQEYWKLEAEELDRMRHSKGSA